MFIPDIFNHVLFLPQNSKNPPYPNLTHLSRFDYNSIALIKSSLTSADYTESSLITVSYILANDRTLLFVSSTLGAFSQINH